MKSLSRRELIQKLRKLGFEGPYSGGKHQFMKKGNLKLRIPNPHKGSIGTGLLMNILAQAGINKDEWQ